MFFSAFEIVLALLTLFRYEIFHKGTYDKVRMVLCIY